MLLEVDTRKEIERDKECRVVWLEKQFGDVLEDCEAASEFNLMEHQKLWFAYLKRGIRIKMTLWNRSIILYIKTKSVLQG